MVETWKAPAEQTNNRASVLEVVVDLCRVSSLQPALTDLSEQHGEERGSAHTAVRQPLSLPHGLSFPDSPRHNARDTAVKITGLLHGNTEEEEEEEEEEEAGLVGREAETRSPASAVGRPTAAVDVELSELGSRSLLTHTGIVYTGWWQARAGGMSRCGGGGARERRQRMNIISSMPLRNYRGLLGPRIAPQVDRPPAYKLTIGKRDGRDSSYHPPDGTREVRIARGCNPRLIGR
ncbi:hypothetical protein EYF80_005595 [Liparis tanakae]|uniref:Uncharacterized protein n=1 Tax=Liparis tanakae TaxID=230148 RepID=A0A4Z2J3J4_9TELE|nr:hypothetical protein EYF80_005595 [Liparis tanakae]